MIPDQIQREVVLRHPIERVWAALTTAEGLAGWFGSSAELELRPGGRAIFRWEELGTEVAATITLVDPPFRFAFVWGLEGLPSEDPHRTLVEFTLDSVPDGTKVHLVESGFAQVAADLAKAAHQANSQGWDSELAELKAFLDAALS